MSVSHIVIKHNRNLKVTWSKKEIELILKFNVPESYLLFCYCTETLNLYWKKFSCFDYWDCIRWRAVPTWIALYLYLGYVIITSDSHCHCHVDFRRGKITQCLQVAVLFCPPPHSSDLLMANFLSSYALPPPLVLLDVYSRFWMQIVALFALVSYNSTCWHVCRERITHVVRYEPFDAEIVLLTPFVIPIVPRLRAVTIVMKLLKDRMRLIS